MITFSCVKYHLWATKGIASMPVPYARFSLAQNHSSRKYQTKLITKNRRTMNKYRKTFAMSLFYSNHLNIISQSLAQYVKLANIPKAPTMMKSPKTPIPIHARPPKNENKILPQKSIPPEDRKTRTSGTKTDYLESHHLLSID